MLFQSSPSLHCAASAGPTLRTRAPLHVYTPCYQPERISGIRNVNYGLNILICQNYLWPLYGVLSRRSDESSISDLSEIIVVSQTFPHNTSPFQQIPEIDLFSNFTSLHPHKVYISQCIVAIIPWINCVWVQSSFFVTSFEISPPLHQSAWKAWWL